MYHVSAQGVGERMINVHYYYYCILLNNPQAKPAVSNVYPKQHREVEGKC